MIKPVQRDLYAVIGNPVEHSLSPIMMNAGFRAIGYKACYLAFEVDDIACDLDILHRVGISGLSVTIPHKEAVIALCESLDQTARAIGAVNTLKRTPTGWQGRNTDWLGIVRPISRFGSLKGKKALIIGAGGAARAAVFGLSQEGANITITNRSEKRGLKLAHEFECRFVSLDQFSKERYEIVVQCTPLGMQGFGSDLSVPKDFFEPSMIVMDVVYRPMWTSFLKSARDSGCRVVTGLEMLLHQGLAQFEWWTDRDAPEEAMRSALYEALCGERNG